jgi:hypothetical protein
MIDQFQLGDAAIEIEIIDVGSEVELMTSLWLDGSGRWAWSCPTGLIDVIEISYQQGRFQRHRIKLCEEGTALVHYRVNAIGRVVMCKCYYAQDFVS